jgi:hypothetical protein
MSVTPERRAEIEALMDSILGPPPLPKPKVVASNGVVIRDADVHVSPADRRNSQYGLVETVHVRRREPEWLRPADHRVVTINIAEAEMQRAQRQYDADALRQLRREADPFNLGHWGPHDD